MEVKVLDRSALHRLQNIQENSTLEHGSAAESLLHDLRFRIKYLLYYFLTFVTHPLHYLQDPIQVLTSSQCTTPRKKQQNPLVYSRDLTQRKEFRMKQFRLQHRKRYIPPDPAWPLTAKCSWVRSFDLSMIGVPTLQMVLFS
jgi:hypothetical protein